MVYDKIPALIADIGGTNARFAILTNDGIISAHILKCADYPTLETAIEYYFKIPEVSEYLKTQKSSPLCAAIAIAGPVMGDTIVMTNHHWTFSVFALKQHFNFRSIRVLNDLEAIAYAVSLLKVTDMIAIGDGAQVSGCPIGIIAPGTGLGVSTAFPMENGNWLAVAGEGGHVTLAAQNQTEFDLLQILREKYHHVSAERLLSGKGLLNFYPAYLRLLSRDEPEFAHTLPPERTAEEITTAAANGSCSACVRMMDMFCAMLGTMAGNLALNIGARGGIYLAGGIMPKILPILQHSRFRERFMAKGRMRGFVEGIPTYVVTTDLPAFLGLEVFVKAGNF